MSSSFLPLERSDDHMFVRRTIGWPLDGVTLLKHWFALGIH